MAKKAVYSGILVLGVITLLATVSSYSYAERVVRVIDGDTIELSDGERVRYIGIDTPESVHPNKSVEFMGKEASVLNRKLVEGKIVRLEFDVQERDRYGRLLAYVYFDDMFVNAELVRLGYAKVMTIPPNVKHSELFVQYQKYARTQELGLWADQPNVQRLHSGEYWLNTGSNTLHNASCRYYGESKAGRYVDDPAGKDCGICGGAKRTVGRQPQ